MNLRGRSGGKVSVGARLRHLYNKFRPFFSTVGTLPNWLRYKYGNCVINTEFVSSQVVLVLHNPKKSS